MVRKGEKGREVRLIFSFQNADRVLSFYNHSVARALVEIFPDISLDINKFSYRSSIIPPSK